MFYLYHPPTYLDMYESCVSKKIVCAASFTDNTHLNIKRKTCEFTIDNRKYLCLVL